MYTLQNRQEKATVTHSEWAIFIEKKWHVLFVKKVRKREEKEKRRDKGKRE